MFILALETVDRYGFSSLNDYQFESQDILCLVSFIHLLLFFLGWNPFICNLYIYIQQIAVRIWCYGLGRGTH
jgi:hypothetical protein